jgi:hypothetical protein
VSLKRSKAVIELGKRLVTQLDAADDLLASWMAHHIAERIEAADNAPASEKIDRQNDCAEAILQLWHHRSVLPPHLRPLGEIEPVMRTLASLDVDQTDYRYHRNVLREAALADVDDEDTKHWLELATGVDYTARLLIQSALRAAAARAALGAHAWVELAKEAGADDGADRAVVRFIIDNEDDSDPVEVYDNAYLRDRLSRLEAFVQLASALAEEWRTQLDAAERKAT